MGRTREEWAQEQLERVSAELASAPAGDRNNALFRSAARMSSYIALGVISEDTVRTTLAGVASGLGLGSHEVNTTISSGIERDDASQAWFPSSSSGVGELLQRRGAANREPMMSTTSGTQTVRLVMYAGGIKATQGAPVEWTWQELADALAAPHMENTPKQLLPLWGFHDIENSSRARILDGDRSRPPKVYALTALALDYDDDPDFSEAAVRRWWGSVQHVAHTTRHHLMEKDEKPAAPRGRVIVALSRPVAPEEVQQLIPWLTSGIVGKPALPELKSSARAYFVPVQTSTYWSTAVLNGQALDVDALLAAEEDGEQGVLERFDMIGGDYPRPRASVGNVVVALEWDPQYAGTVRRNDFAGHTEYRGSRIRDVDEAMVAMELAARYGLHVSSAKVSEAMMIAAELNRYHPVRDYLEHVKWDGVERLATWLARYMRAPEDLLVTEYGMRWMIGAVARVMQPGCKMDNTLILVGEQGVRKSSALRILAGGWFADATIDVRNKDAFAVLQGVWVYEWAELDSMRRGDATAIKSYLTSQVDHYRPAYGRHVVQVPRQTVFVGTTNEDTFLTDSTGSRRFWPVKVGRIDLEALQSDRDQLWAEAVALYRSGVRWWLDEDSEALRAADAVDYSHVDPWTDSVARYAHGNAPCTISEVLAKALDKSAGAQGKGDAMRVAGILQELGMIKRRQSVNGQRVVVWAWP